MGWNKANPAGSTKIRLGDDVIRDNNAYLEDFLGVEHGNPGTYPSAPTTGGRHKWGFGTSGVRGGAIPAPFSGNFWPMSDAGVRWFQIYDGSSWLDWLGYYAGNNASKPAIADLPANIFTFFNTDKGHPEVRSGGAWVDLWPGIKLQKAESALASGSYTSAYAYVRNTADSADLSVDVVVPATGTWKIFALAIVKATGPAGSNKAMLQAQIHRAAVAVGQEAGSSYPDYSGGPFAYSAMPIDLFDSPANSTTYTYKVQARSQQNNSTRTAAGLFTLLLRVN